jgi:hypothetical protein
LPYTKKTVGKYGLPATVENMKTLDAQATPDKMSGNFKLLKMSDTGHFWNAS